MILIKSGEPHRKLIYVFCLHVGMDCRSILLFVWIVIIHCMSRATSCGGKGGEKHDRFNTRKA